MQKKEISILEYKLSLIKKSMKLIMPVCIFENPSNSLINKADQLSDCFNFSKIANVIYQNPYIVDATKKNKGFNFLEKLFIKKNPNTDFNYYQNKITCLSDLYYIFQMGNEINNENINDIILTTEKYINFKKISNIISADN